MSTDNFFSKKSDWARRKHLILSYYLDPAIKKLRYASPDRRVVILDGFAGRGKYEEDSHGSPIYTGNLAEECRMGENPLQLHIRNIEQRSEHFAVLEDVTSRWVDAGYVKNINDTFQNALPKVLNDAANSALFAFLDPYNPTQMVFNDFLPLLQRNAKTEVCVVFFTNVVRRNLHALLPGSNSSESYKKSTGETLTKIFGSPAWQTLINKNTLTFNDILNCLAIEIKSQAQQGYSNQPGFVVWHPIFTRKTLKKEAKGLRYHMVFWTRHKDGLVLMNDAFAKEYGVLEEMADDLIKQATLAKAYGQHTFLFEEFDINKQSQLEQFRQLMDSIVHIVRISQKKWTRSDLVEQSIMDNFGNFSATKHRQAVQALVDKEDLPRLKPLNAHKKRGTKTVLNDNTVLELET